MNKYEQACAQYVLANQEVKRLTGLIHISISKCRTATANERFTHPSDPEIELCLSAYYRQVAATPSVYGVDPDYPMLECDFCMQTEKLIQDRKKARAALGAAKRRITVLGKKAIKQENAMLEARGK